MPLARSLRRPSLYLLVRQPDPEHRQVLPRVLRQRARGLGTQGDRLARLPLPNKELLAEWIETYGVDSDFVRVRVRGLPPAADELQFIDRERIKEAQEREPQSLDDDPLICGVDVCGGGAAWNVAAFRRGGDARSIPRIRIPGEHTRDRNVLVGRSWPRS